MAKLFASETAMDVVIKAVQILEKVAVRSLRRFGTFMAMVAERK